MSDNNQSRESQLPEKYTDPEQAARIYVLPNLMTAGNLLCGFIAIILCMLAKFNAIMASYVPATLDPKGRDSKELFELAVLCILISVVFDALDGNVARRSGKESLFGKEFDSIADIISFGLAPCLMVFFLILQPTEEYPNLRTLAGAISFVYLLCAGIRLARFNVITHPATNKTGKYATTDFLGLPVPAAAGMVSSLVLLTISHEIRWLAYLMPAFMVLIALLMVSTIRYPSFKAVNWRTRVSPVSFAAGFLAAIAILYFYHVSFAIVFVTYILYGIWRHFFGKKRANNL